MYFELSWKNIVKNSANIVSNWDVSVRGDMINEMESFGKK